MCNNDSWVSTHQSVPPPTLTALAPLQDNTLCYEPFYDDFGPLNLSKFWR